MAYMAAVGQKWVTPSEFWSMPPGEFWWLVEANTPQGPSTDMEELYQMLLDAEALEA